MHSRVYDQMPDRSNGHRFARFGDNDRAAVKPTGYKSKEDDARPLGQVQYHGQYAGGSGRSERRESGLGNSGDMVGMKRESFEREEAYVVTPQVMKLAKRTGYPVRQHNGQRTYGPHANDEGKRPPRGCEVFVGKIPRDLYEDELVPMFETVGRLYTMRLMMDFDGRNRGYCFITYLERAHARIAIESFNNFEIRKGRYLGVCSSVDNCRLFIGGIPKNKSRDEIKQEIMCNTDGVKDVIVYPSLTDPSKNRGFAFVEYRDHRSAAMARRKLAPGRVLIFSTQVAVDWAEPEDDMDDDIMSKVKILYVRNIAGPTTEDDIKTMFEPYGALERVKKLRDYAFVHFGARNEALNAMQALNGSVVDGQMWEVTLAKPVTDKTDANKMAMVGAKALAAAQAGVDPEMLQATQTANYLLQGGSLASVPDIIHSNNVPAAGEAVNMDWKYLARIYPARSGKGRAAMRSCYLGYSAGKATYGRYYTKNQIEKTNQLLATMQKEVFSRLENAITSLVENLNFGKFRVLVEYDNCAAAFIGRIFFSNVSQDNPAYVSMPFQSYDLARRAILEQAVTGLSGILQSVNRQQPHIAGPILVQGQPMSTNNVVMPVYHTQAVPHVIQAPTMPVTVSSETVQASQNAVSAANSTSGLHGAFPVQTVMAPLNYPVMAQPVQMTAAGQSNHGGTRYFQVSNPAAAPAVIAMQNTSHTQVSQQTIFYPANHAAVQGPGFTQNSVSPNNSGAGSPDNQVEFHSMTNYSGKI